jgi:site-specific DNA recombinase
MELDGYIRVSRVGGRDGESFISPRVQRERIEAFAAAHGHRVVRWHEDLDQPGSRAQRPGFQDALARVEAGETAGIAVAKLDRFARSVADAAVAIRRIDAAGGQLVSVEDGFDSSTPMGRFALTILLALAELELGRIRESWATAQAYAVQRGVHIASKSPTGYRRGDDGRLVPVTSDAEVVRNVFRRRAAGASWRELADLLGERGVVGPYGSERWTTGAVRGLVSNPVYTGEARFGRHRNADAHPAIVSHAEWNAAQGARSASVPRSPDGALLSGLLRCGGCRYVLKPDSMRDRDGETIRHYRCRGEHAAGRCPSRVSALGRVIEPYIEAAFLGALGSNGPLARSARCDREVETARTAVEEAEAEMALWVEMSATKLGQAVYLAGLHTRQEALDTAHKRLQEALSRAAGPLGGIPSAVDLRVLWPEMSVPERRRLLAAAIDAVILFPGREAIESRALVLWRGQAPSDLPRRGRRVPLRSFERPDAIGPPLPQDLDEREVNRPVRRRRHTARAVA